MSDAPYNKAAHDLLIGLGFDYHRQPSTTEVGQPVEMWDEYYKNDQPVFIYPNGVVNVANVTEQTMPDYLIGKIENTGSDVYDGAEEEEGKAITMMPERPNTGHYRPPGKPRNTRRQRRTTAALRKLRRLN